MQTPQRPAIVGNVVLLITSCGCQSRDLLASGCERRTRMLKLSFLCIRYECISGIVPYDGLGTPRCFVRCVVMPELMDSAVSRIHLGCF